MPGCLPPFERSTSRQRAELTETVAKNLLKDDRLISAYEGGDRNAVAAEINSICERFSFSGYVWVVDKSGNLFFASDTPKAYGYSVLQDNYGIEVARSNDRFYQGVTFNDKTKVVALSYIVPMGSRGKNGILAASLPLNMDFLTGLATRFGIENPASQGIQLAVFRRTGRKARSHAFFRKTHELKAKRH